MSIKQLSIFIENKPGRLADVTECISKAGINMYALSIADTTDFGIVRIIVDKTEEAAAVLKEFGFTVKETDVIAVAIEHRPGGLSNVLRKIGTANASIKYMYAFTGQTANHSAIVIIRFANQGEVLAKLESVGIRLLHMEDINNLCM
ncbi:MAG: amino acid-binding protein [Defluviitaleaceae bacterium]|nr:amino acid-binding protein [Defluviitaleaceae bacterium]